MSAEGMLVEVFRLPSEPILLSFPYDGWQEATAQDHEASLRARLNSLSLRDFCDDLGLSVDEALGRAIE